MRSFLVCVVVSGVLNLPALGSELADARAHAEGDFLEIWRSNLPAVLQSAPTPPIARGELICTPVPLLARVPLPDEMNYIRNSKMTFDMDGTTVRISASKDQNAKYGYYMVFLVEGNPQQEPVWRSVGLSKEKFSLHDGKDGKDKVFYVELHGAWWNHLAGHDERTSITLTRENGSAVVVAKPDGQHAESFTTGELAKAVQETGPLMELSMSPPAELKDKLPVLPKRSYRATYFQDIEGVNGRARPLPGKHSLLVTTYDAYAYDGNKTGYAFKRYYFDADEMRGKTIYPKFMETLNLSKRQKINIEYGFHITAHNQLEVYDTTQYQPNPKSLGLPYCPPAD